MITQQYSRCCVLQLPQRSDSAFAGVVSSGCAGTRPRLASTACTPARPVANPPARIGLVSSARPVRPTDAHRCSALPADRRRSIRLASNHPRSTQLAPNGPSPGNADNLPPTRIEHRPLARLAASSGLRRSSPQLPRLASASGLLRLLSPSGFTGRPPLSLHLAVSSPAEPLMHSLLPPNLASPAEPSMSIPFPPAFASSGIIQFNNFRLAPSLVASGASSDPSQACTRDFTLCPG